MRIIETERGGYRIKYIHNVITSEEGDKSWKDIPKYCKQRLANRIKILRKNTSDTIFYNPEWDEIVAIMPHRQWWDWCIRNGIGNGFSL